MFVLEANPVAFKMGEAGELTTKMQECYNAWVETPGAFAVIDQLIKEESARERAAAGAH